MGKTNKSASLKLSGPSSPTVGLFLVYQFSVILYLKRSNILMGYTKKHLEDFVPNRTKRDSYWKQKALRQQKNRKERTQGLPSITVLIPATKFTERTIRMLILQLYLVP